MDIKPKELSDLIRCKVILDTQPQAAETVKYILESVITRIVNRFDQEVDQLKRATTPENERDEL